MPSNVRPVTRHASPVTLDPMFKKLMERVDRMLGRGVIDEELYEELEEALLQADSREEFPRGLPVLFLGPLHGLALQVDQIVDDQAGLRDCGSDSRQRPKNSRVARCDGGIRSPKSPRPSTRTTPV